MAIHDASTGPQAPLGTTVDPEVERRWRSLARAATDVDAVRRTGRELRDELRGLDLAGSLAALAVLAEESHALGRFVQADLDAVWLVVAAGEPVPDESLVAFAPEPGAVRADRDDAGRWALTGTQRRSVHPAAVDRVLVVARTDEGDRWFSCEMADPRVTMDRAPLRTIAPQDPNGPVTFTAAPATPLGTAAWWPALPRPYDFLLRDAACWLGACLWLQRRIAENVPGGADPAALVRIGRTDVWVASARGALWSVVPLVEADPTTPRAELAARRAVAVTATTADTVIRLVALLSDARVASEDASLPSRVAQLQIALRRFDTEANLHAIGLLVSRGEPL